MNITAEQIRASLVAAGVAAGKQDKIVTDLLTIQGTPPPAPPLSADEKRAIINFFEKGSPRNWSSWSTREAQARIEMPALFAAWDAWEAADAALNDELANIEKILP